MHLHQKEGLQKTGLIMRMSAMNDQYKRDFLHAGKLAKEARAFGKELLKPGASYNQVIAQIQQKIAALGGQAAFPPQIALNEVAAHFLPEPGEDIILSNQVVKLDLGVSYEGAIGDCAVTVDLSGRHQKLVDAAEAALLAAESLVEVGRPLRDIGKAIEKTITSYGFVPVRNLSGHGLARYKIHTPPSIPNYDDRSTRVVKAGMTFAIEPFATTGMGLIYDAGNPTIFSLIGSRPVKSEVSRALLSKAKTFNGLPFAMHDLVSAELPLAIVKKGLAELLKAGIFAGYAPLIEEGHGLVAQAENSILVDGEGKVFITTR